MVSASARPMGLSYRRRIQYLSTPTHVDCLTRHEEAIIHPRHVRTAGVGSHIDLKLFGTFHENLKTNCRQRDGVLEVKIIWGALSVSRNQPIFQLWMDVDLACPYVQDPTTVQGLQRIVAPVVLAAVATDCQCRSNIPQNRRLKIPQ